MASLRLSTSEVPSLLKSTANLTRVADKAPRPCSLYAQQRNLHSQPLQSPRAKSNAGKYISRVQRTPNFPSQLPPLRHHLNSAYSTTITDPSTTTPGTSAEPTITPVFETVTGTFQYLVADPTTKQAAIVDPVLDYDPVTQNVTTASADKLLALISSQGYTVPWILETHAHADHLTAAGYLRRQLERVQGVRPKVGIGKRIGQVQERFGKRYGVPSGEYECVFDVLFDDDEEFAIGELKGRAMHLPGHTPDHLGYKIQDNVFCGDSLFHVDIGTARCDFPGGSTTALWQSAQKLLALPDNVKIWTGHDYPPDGRSEPVPYMTVKQHKELNKHVKQGTKEEDFVAMRTERDAKLAAPRLLHQSLQVNVRGGNLPAENEAGLRLLHLPMKVKEVW